MTLPAIARRAVLGTIILASPAAAQLVEVHLREEVGNAPIAGAVVRLLRDSAEVAQALTNAGGRALLRAPSPGMYRIAVHRIGFRPVLSEVLALDEAQTITRELSMSSAAFVLPTVAVQTKSECGAKMADGAMVAALWEQIGTALSANVLTQRQWVLPLQVKRFRRDVTLKDSVTSEMVVGSYVVHGPPFGSADPAVLAKAGFVAEDQSGTTFSAPDAALLLSDEFINTHCFSAVPGKDSSVGLAFEPAPRQRLPDVRGTLWIDTRTNQLESLDYTYTGLRGEMAMVALGGRLDFNRLPTGAWIVRHWYIRMPHVFVTPATHTFARGRQIIQPEVRVVDRFIEEGGRVELAESDIAAAPRAIALGRIVDSTTGGMLPGAVVRFMGQADSAVTDSLGRFRLAVPVGGTQTIVATHAKLGLIQDSSTHDVHLSLGDSTTVNFTVPSAARLGREFCGASDPTAAGIVGLAFTSDGSSPEGLGVRVSWEPVAGRVLDERAETGPKGIYAVCGLPGGQLLTVRLLKGATTIGTQSVKLEPGGYRWIELKPPT